MANIQKCLTLRDKMGMVYVLGRRLVGESANFPDGYKGARVWASSWQVSYFLDQSSKRGVWAVFEVDADWRRDVYQHQDGNHYLLVDSVILWNPNNQ